jgi:Mg2+ and Co2+ transporter CorA
LNHDVVRQLGAHKDLHPLAVEDVLDTNTPTKADWYDSHCYMELTMQKLVRLQQGHNQNIDTAYDPSKLLDEDQISRRAKWRTLSHRKYAISVEQVAIFLCQDNTVITIFEHAGHDVLKPILTRLNSPKTIIRSSNDPSLLVQAVIDVVVDMSVPIGKAVDEMFGELETAVLSTPTITQSKQLYILRSGLTLLMDNIIATGGLVRTLVDHRTMLNNQTSSNEGAVGPAQGASTGVNITATTQVYLQDVQDHITALSNSTHNSIRSAENLTSLIFNTIAASQNESVRQLTLVSSFFLPLTFLTGYFGMNFAEMPIVTQHSDGFFWLIAGPVMLVTGSLLLGARIIRMIPLRKKRTMQHLARKKNV